MNMEVKRGSIDNTSPVCIFLPMCTESIYDVFMSFLRYITGRSRVDYNSVDKSFIAGLQTEFLQIEAEDVGDWTNLSTTVQQERQAMMLGFWSIKNLPTLASRLCGDTWQAPQRKCVNVVGGQSMMPDEFDGFVFGKIILRIIDLRMSRSILTRIKHFVKAPSHVGKIDGVQVSRKMFAYNIESRFEIQCWAALRSGEYTDVGNQTDEPVQQLTNSSMESDSESINSDQNSLVAMDSCHLAKRRRQDCLTGDESTATSPLTIESLKMDLAKIQKDIGEITKWLNPGDNSENCADDLRKKVDSLKNDNAKLYREIESKAELISTLQKEVASNYSLYEKCQSETILLKESIDKQQENNTIQELKTAKAIIERMQNSLTSNIETITELRSTVTSLETNLSESTENGRQLGVELNEWKVYGQAKDDELKAANSSIRRLKEQLNSLSSSHAETITQLRSTVTSLETNLSESTENGRQLGVELNEWKVYGQAKDEELKAANSSIRRLKEQLNSLSSSHAETITQLRSTVKSLETNLAESTENGRQLGVELNEWKVYGQAKDEELKAVNSSTRRLEEQLNSLSSSHTETITKLQCTVTESTNKIGSLEVMLNEWNIYGTRKDKEAKEAEVKLTNMQSQVKSLKSEIGNILPEMKCQIDKLDAELSESTKKNRELEVTLKEWKANGLVKDNELKQAKLLIESLRTNLNRFNEDLPEQPEVTMNAPVINGENQLAGASISVLTSLDGHNSDQKFLFTDEVQQQNESGMIKRDDQLTEGTMPAFSLLDDSNSTVTDAFAQNRDQPEVFETDDPVVIACRPILIKQRFGLIRFTSKKNCVACPGFRYSPDEDGLTRAQRIVTTGYVSDTKKKISRFDENIPETEK